MAENKRIEYIPAKPPKREQRVGIYARVSSNSAEQLQSLSAQVSHLTRVIAANQRWLLVDVYMDIASSKTGSSRKEFARMLKDCQSHELEIIFAKSVSRFGRDTEEILDALHRLKLLGVRVVFEQEALDTADTDNNLMISILESIAQAENELRSGNIKWGIQRRAESGASKLFNRKCYGYTNAKDGSLTIEKKEEENVKLIFDLYLQGKSVIGIVSELARLGIKSPTGKDKWCKRTIDIMLSNEKYAGNVRPLNDGKHDKHYLARDNNPVIIAKETFQAVQIEKQHRSNVATGENGNRRKGEKYSSKQ